MYEKCLLLGHLNPVVHWQHSHTGIVSLAFTWLDMMAANSRQGTKYDLYRWGQNPGSATYKLCIIMKIINLSGLNFLISRT